MGPQVDYTCIPRVNPGHQSVKTSDMDNMAPVYDNNHDDDEDCSSGNNSNNNNNSVDDVDDYVNDGGGDSDDNYSGIRQCLLKS